MNMTKLPAQDRKILTKLHPDLQAALDDRFGLMVHHPLVITSLYRPFDRGQIEEINATYLRQKELVQQFKAEREFRGCLFLTKRPYRLDMFVDQLVPLLKDQQYWKLLSFVWVDTEGPHLNFSTWAHLFASERKFRPMLMDKAERAALAAMPDVLTIYRGGSTKKGLSWTLTEEKARWFASRHRDGKSRVYKATVPKDKVYAYLNGRKEHEIVVNPKFVTME